LFTRVEQPQADLRVKPQDLFACNSRLPSILDCRGAKLLFTDAAGFTNMMLGYWTDVANILAVVIVRGGSAVFMR